MANSRLEDVLDKLADGHITTPEAARQVRGMTFPVKPGKTPFQTMEADGAGDPEVPEEGSFLPVSRAYAMGRITRVQYDALAEAASAATKAG